jgi:UrcA family protein
MNQVIMIALAGAALSTAAHAQIEPLNGPATASVIVAYADLDLSTAPGAKAMLKRISSAARRACGEYPPAGSALTVDAVREWHACQHRTVRAGVARLNHPAVSSLFAASHPGSVELAHR